MKTMFIPNCSRLISIYTHKQFPREFFFIITNNPYPYICIISLPSIIYHGQINFSFYLFSLFQVLLWRKSFVFGQANHLIRFHLVRFTRVLLAITDRTSLFSQRGNLISKFSFISFLLITFNSNIIGSSL